MSETNHLYEINRDLGSILARLDSIQLSQTDIVANIKDISKEQQRVKLEMDDMRDTVDGMKPFVDKAKQWEQRGIGAAFVLTSIGAIFGGTIAAFREKIFTLLAWS